MLENNILATNMIYITIFHKQENIKKYLKVFEKFFLIFQTKISKKIHKSNLCFNPIKRIN